MSVCPEFFNQGQTKEDDEENGFESKELHYEEHEDEVKDVDAVRKRSPKKRVLKREKSSVAGILKNEKIAKTQDRNLERSGSSEENKDDAEADQYKVEYRDSLMNVMNKTGSHKKNLKAVDLADHAKFKYGIYQN